LSAPKIEQLNMAPPTCAVGERSVVWCVQ